jgi:hypothetical protein
VLFIVDRLRSGLGFSLAKEMRTEILSRDDARRGSAIATGILEDRQSAQGILARPDGRIS